MDSPSFRPLQILAPALTATDPVCGMAVNPETALSAERDGVRWWFCHERCREQFEHPERFPVQLLPSATGYICPMCPEVHSPEPGSCPRCGMALEPAGGAAATSAEFDPLSRRLLFAVIATIPVFVLAMGPMIGLNVERWVTATQSAWIQAILATAVVLFAGGSYWRIGLMSFVTRQLNMFSLLVIGVGAALLASWFALLAPAEWLGSMLHAGHRPLYFESAAVITTLMLLGQRLEAGARRQTTAALTELTGLAPRIAHVRRQNHLIDLPLSVIRVGDQVEIRPGEQVPLDGKVLDGESTLDEALLTGESEPVIKTNGSSVVGGAINQTGRLVIRVTHTAQQTVLAQIVRLVAEAQRSRAPIQRLADQVAAWFVPAVLGVSLLTLVLWLWLGPEPRWVWALSCAVSVLIIACPCALGLATPMAITTGVGRGAKAGILFRDAASLEILAGVDTLFLDKTGTLTEGRPQVSVTHPTEGIAPAELLFWAASVEQASEHPWARALVAAAAARGIKLAPVEEFRSVTGFGVEGRVHGHLVRVGRPDWNEHELNPFADQGGTPLQVVATLDGAVLGGFAFGDLLRPAAKSTITRLRMQGLDCVMLTGDRIAVAEQAARTLGLTHFQAELSPAQKHLFITTVQRRHRVAMAGDGINDAPALAAADVGIALGSGTDIAQQAAGVVLLSSDLRGLPRSVELSRAVRATIQQNLLFAFLYNALGIPLAAGLFYPLTGWLLDPMLAAAAMSLSSVSVVINSLRLRWRSLD